jgi:hypothetical protein
MCNAYGYFVTVDMLFSYIDTLDKLWTPVVTLAHS